MCVNVCICAVCVPCHVIPVAMESEGRDSMRESVCMAVAESALTHLPGNVSPPHTPPLQLLLSFPGIIKIDSFGGWGVVALKVL